MAINPLLQWLVNTAKTSATTVKKNTEKKANKVLWWLVTTQKETMPQARAKALLPWLVKVAETTGKIWQQNVANQQAKAKELLGGMTKDVTKWYVKAKDQTLSDLQADISLWMPQEELKNFYPDIPDTVVNDLYVDIQAGMPIEEAKKFYPEIYQLPKVEEKKTIGKNIKEWLWKAASLISPVAWAVQAIWPQKVLNAWVGALEWAASVWWQIGKWLAYIDPTQTVQEYTQWQEKLDKKAPKPIQDIRWTESYGVGKKIGKTGAEVALTYPLWWGGWSLWVLGKTALWAWAWALQTQAANLISEWKPASLKETAIGAWLWWTLWAVGWLIGKVKKWAYDSAFSQAGQSTKKELAKYGQTAWESVMEQKLPASVKWWLKVIKEKLWQTWKAIETTADTAWDVQWWVVREWLKTDLIKKLWYDKLNQSSQSTKELIGKVWDIVYDMIPDWVIKPKEIVQQIKQINSTLPNTLLSKWFQDLKGNSKIQKVITTGLKDVLDKAVEQWWGQADKIKSLYSQYWKQKTVETILQDESIRKILGRQLVWWVWWAWVGAIAWYEDFKEWNLLWWLWKVLAFSVVWTQATKLAKNPSFLMKIGKAAEKLSKWTDVVRKWLVPLSSKIEK